MKIGMFAVFVMAAFVAVVSETLDQRFALASSSLVEVCPDLFPTCVADPSCSQCDLSTPLDFYACPVGSDNYNCCQYNLQLAQQTFGTSCDVGDSVTAAFLECAINQFHELAGLPPPCETYPTPAPALGTPDNAPTSEPTASVSSGSSLKAKTCVHVVAAAVLPVLLFLGV